MRGKRTGLSSCSLAPCIPNCYKSLLKLTGDGITFSKGRSFLITWCPSFPSPWPSCGRKPPWSICLLLTRLRTGYGRWWKFVELWPLHPSLGRYVNTKPVFLLVSCPPASHLSLLEAAARAGPGLSQVALPMLIITDFPHATQVLPLGWNIQEGMLHTPLFFISVAVLGQAGADLKPDMTWLVKFVPFIFSGSSCCCCCTFHGLCCTCSAIKGGTSIRGSGRSFPLLLLGFG